jgi:asparagine synthase (glutamine-hydrolysing)
VCGIAGIVRASPSTPVDELALLRMAAAIRHRGPDGFGLCLDDGAGLVSARLAIVDLASGWQPLRSGPGGSVLVYNGEVYNHPELRAALRAEGVAFETHSDTEVVQAVLERKGTAGLELLNGQFALAWWQPGPRRLTLVRDRFGVRPLHYATDERGSLFFGSEAKALFASGEVEAAPDPAGLDDVFTLWAPQSPRTAFAGVSQVEAGGLLVWERGRIVERRRWWSADPREQNDPGAGIEELMRDSVNLRLRADVQVGAYLSGGLDSSLISALAQVEQRGDLTTFSVAFDDPAYDERAHQETVARAIGTRHHVLEIGSADIAAALPEVIRHTETPLVRTAPVPLYLLAAAVNEHDLKVVATGEGADELFWGYDLFKEVAIRDLHEREPQRALELLGRLYPHLGSAARRGPGWTSFLLGTGAGDDPLSSHMTRVAATESVRGFYCDEMRGSLAEQEPIERLRGRLPEGFGALSDLERAAWLEVTTLLEPYLLAAQGDRVSMAHGVEGRYPFLDHRLYALSVGLPPEEKLTQESDKVALRRLAAEVLPAEIADRGKQPYRAPEVTPFFGPGAPDWVEEALSPAAIEATGVWDAGRVAGLVRRCRAGRARGVREGMAVVGIITTQLWHEELIRGGSPYPAETSEPRIRIDRRTKSAVGEAS